MNQSRLSGISFRQIEIFLAVAKYENFTKAANELFMTQASVSRNIQNLELSLGLVLFIRHKKRAFLTNAGKDLAKDFRQLYQWAEKALDNAFLQQKNQFCNLIIGDVNCTSMDSYLLPISQEFESRYPDITLTLDRSDPITVCNNLRLGKYDAAYLINVGVPDMLSAGLQGDLLFHTPPCIVMANTHPLFAQHEITITDLQNQPMVTMRSEAYKPYWEFTKQVCLEANIHTSDILFVDNTFTLAMELKRGKRIAVMDRCFAPMNQSELRYIPLTDCQTQSGITLIYDENNTNPYLTKYREICKELGPKLIRFAYE